MLILFFGLVILCALFFGMGFTMGKNSVRSAPELLATPTTARPSAGENRPATATPIPDSKSAPAASPVPTGSAAASPSPPEQTPTPQGAAAQPGTGYFVQVAAVSKQEDADALVEALKGHQYEAFIATQVSDKLFHVQVGPFADIKDAEAIRAKLVSDGYSPILKK
jgi:cell division septation protein DedD